jgi:hypothetical protein
VYGGEGGNYNLINNYYRYGPSTNKNTKFRIVNPSRQEKPAVGFGKYYVQGNYVDGADDVSKNNWLGIHLGNGGTEEDKKAAVIDKPHVSVTIPIQPAAEAYRDVLAGVGASFRRDTLDQRIINNVKERTGRIIDVQGGYQHGTEYNITVNAWPALRSLPAATDTDKDGMPDEWEKKQGLDSSNTSDATGYKLSNVYTNIEVYINSLLQK